MVVYVVTGVLINRDRRGNIYQTEILGVYRKQEDAERMIKIHAKFRYASVYFEKHILE